MNALLLRPLPVSDAASLSAVYTRDQLNPGDLLDFLPNYKDYRDRNQAFSSVALYSVLGVTLTGTAEPQRLVGQVVSGNYFDTLGSAGAWAGVHPCGGPNPERGAGGGDQLQAVDGALRRRSRRNETQAGVERAGVRHRRRGAARVPGLDTLMSVDVWIPMTMYQRVYPFPALVEQRRALLFSVVGG